MSGKAILNFPSMLTAHNHMMKLITWTEEATLLQSIGLYDNAGTNERRMPFSYGLMPMRMDRIEVGIAMISPLAMSWCMCLCETLLRPHDICSIALMTLFLVPSMAVFGFSISTLLLILLVFDFLLMYIITITCRCLLLAKPGLTCVHYPILYTSCARTLEYLRHQAHPHDAEEVPQVRISVNRHYREGMHCSENGRDCGAAGGR